MYSIYVNSAAFAIINCSYMYVHLSVLFIKRISKSFLSPAYFQYLWTEFRFIFIFLKI